MKAFFLRLKILNHSEQKCRKKMIWKETSYVILLKT